jgi:hypothetical protein
MDEKSLYPAAKALAEAQPERLGQSNFPLIHWWQEGDEIAVILADGRKVRGPLPEKKGEKVQIIAKQLMQLPTKDQESLEFKPPAKKKP